MNDNTLQKILVVEDDALLRESLQEVLTGQGYLVETCQDGIEGLEKVCANRFNLIITDIKMPNLDGNELYLSIVQRYPNMKDKFLFISANFNDLIFKKAAKGKRRHLAKPFKMAEIISYVKAILTESEGRHLALIDKQTIGSQITDNA